MKSRNEVWSTCDLFTCGKAFRVIRKNETRFCCDEHHQEFVRRFQRVACRKNRMPHKGRRKSA